MEHHIKTLAVYTLGMREYALEVMKVIDPGGKISKLHFHFSPTTCRIFPLMFGGNGEIGFWDETMVPTGRICYDLEENSARNNFLNVYPLRPSDLRHLKVSHDFESI